MAFCNRGGARLAYQQLGEGPDVVLVHGLATSRAFWYADLAQILKADYRVTLFDLRGHGYSERAANGYTATDMAGDLAGIMDELDIDRARLVGHSYGGGVALEYALARPERVQRLAVLDTKINRLQPTQRLADSPHLSAFERAVEHADARDWAAESQLGLAYLETAARLCVAGRMPDTRDVYTPFGQGRSGRRAARQYLALIDETSAAADFVASGADRTALAALDVPLLLAYGEYSHCLPSARAMAALQPEARCVTIAGAGHFFPASHGDRLADVLCPFLAGDTPGARPRMAADSLFSEAR